VQQVDIAIQYHPRTLKPDGDRLDDVGGSVVVHREHRVEIADADGTCLRARRRGERAERETD
jgi:hypothetical protein